MPVKLYTYVLTYLLTYVQTAFINTAVIRNQAATSSVSTRR